MSHASDRATRPAVDTATDWFTRTLKMPWEGQAAPGEDDVLRARAQMERQLQDAGHTPERARQISTDAAKRHTQDR